MIELTPEDQAVVAWMVKIEDGLRTSIQTHIQDVLPHDNQIRHAAEKCLFRCLDRISRFNQQHTS